MEIVDKILLNNLSYLFFAKSKHILVFIVSKGWVNNNVKKAPVRPAKNFFPTVDGSQYVPLWPYKNDL